MSTFDRLCTILVRDYRLDAAALRPDAGLEALGIDSLGVAELLFTVEDEFGIHLPAQAVPLATLGEVAGYIDGLVAARSTPADGAPLPPG